MKITIQKNIKKFKENYDIIRALTPNVQNGVQQSKVQNQVIFIIALSTKTLIEFVNLWPLEQWFFSLAGLILLYWLTTKIYNKRLKKKYNTELSNSFRAYMILSDLLINLALGLYYLSYRNTALGQLMISCPIAVSPLIFIVELMFVIFWYEVYSKNK